MGNNKKGFPPVSLATCTVEGGCNLLGMHTGKSLSHPHVFSEQATSQSPTRSKPMGQENLATTSCFTLPCFTDGSDVQGTRKKKGILLRVYPVMEKPGKVVEFHYFVPGLEKSWKLTPGFGKFIKSHGN